MSKTSFIDPIIGTIGDEQFQSTHGGGKTHPGACVPGGMVQLSPDTITGGDNGTGYNFCNTTIEGFSFNHLSGIGWYGDLGNLQIMPTVNNTSIKSGTNEFALLNDGEKGWCSAFSHENETAKAGYYSVILESYNIKAEATVTEHTGFLRFTYPESDNAHLIFNFSRRIGGKADFQEIEISDNHIKGSIKCTPKGGGFGHGGGNISYTVHFYLEFSKPFLSYSVFENGKNLGKIKNAKGENLCLVADFNTAKKEEIIIKAGLSYVDTDGAENNFKKEAELISFDKAYLKAVESWENALSLIDIETDNGTDKSLFYTCLYHTLLDPRTAVDVDGRYMGADGKAHITNDFKYRTVFSGWDVYRSEFPLLTVIRPDIVNDEINSLLSIAIDKNSSLPRWELLGNESLCMVGDPGVIVLSDAYVKGIRNYDTHKAYSFAKASCTGVMDNNKAFHCIRQNSEFMNKYGFNPEKLSSTLEENLADFTLSQFAKAYGNDGDAKMFYQRGMRCKDNFNPETGFMAPRFENGKFMPTLNEYDDEGCVESNIYQQSWFMPQDVKALQKLFGEERFVSLLERFFEKADFTAMWNDDYNHSNEPCHNVTHYFNIIGLPKRTQYWTRLVQKQAYKLGAYGFCGNEDVGQLSAWYVLSAIGFAQVCPSVPKYEINSPLFKKSTVKLDKKYHSCSVADTLTIECDKDPLNFQYIDEIYLNGKKIDRTYLWYDEITNGGKLELKMKNI